MIIPVKEFHMLPALFSLPNQSITKANLLKSTIELKSLPLPLVFTPLEYHLSPLAASPYLSFYEFTQLFLLSLFSLPKCSPLLHFLWMRDKSDDYFSCFHLLHSQTNL